MIKLTKDSFGNKRAMEKVVADSLEHAGRFVLVGSYERSQAQIDRANYYLNILKYEDEITYEITENDGDNE